jgi:hypothetical protein
MKQLNTTLDSMGFKDSASFVDSTFHPNTINVSIIMSTIFGSIAYFIENFLGFEAMVGVAMALLFALEMFTGIKASLREGHDFESRKFGRGILKMFVYMFMIGCAHILAVNVSIKPILGFSFNYYEWIHYACFNFVLIQLFISNIENFNRLGWTEFVPLLPKLSKFLKLKQKKKK